MNWKKLIAIFLGGVLLVVGGAVIFLMTYDYNGLKPQIEAAVKKQTGRELTLDGDISLDLGLNPALVVQDASLANAEWGSKPQMAKVGRFELQLALLPLFQRDIQVQRIVLRDTAILVENNTEGVSNLALQAPNATQGGDEAQSAKDSQQDSQSQKGQLPGLRLDNVLVETAAVEMRDAQGETVASFTVDRLRLQAQADQSIQFDLEGQFNAQAFSVSGTAGALNQALDAQANWPLDVDMQAGEASVQLKGQIRDLFAQRGVTLDLEADLPDTKALQRLLGQEVPVAGPIACSATLTDTAAKQFHVADLALRQGENEITGSADLALDSPLSVQAELASPRLDVSTIFKKASSSGSEGSATTQEKGGEDSRDAKRIFSDTPLPWEALEKIDAQLHFQADALVVPRLMFSDVVLEASVKNGLLEISQLTAGSGDEGSLTATVVANTRKTPPRVECAATVDSFAIEQVLREKKTESVLQGLVSSDLALNGQGRSIAELMAGLNGQFQLTMGKGRLANAKLEKWGADLGANLFRLLNPAEDKGKFTPINCAVLVVPIDSGMARIQALVVDTPRMQLRGQGEVNLHNETLDIGLDPQPKEGVQTGVLGKLSLSLSELAQAVRLGGTLAQPSLTLDKGRAVETLGKGIGGTLLFGPAGAAAGLLGSSDIAADPCLEALEGQEASESQPSEDPDSSQEKLQKGMEELGGKLQKLFE
ncbi:MAG: AsmA family protein [Thermodesulfobacteriota bacterium]